MKCVTPRPENDGVRLYLMDAGYNVL